MGDPGDAARRRLLVPSHGMTTIGTVDVSGLEGGHVSLTSAQLTALAARLEGPVLYPGDEGWGDAAAVFNGMVAKRPALVVQPSSAGDVAAVVRFARDRGLLLGIKGGGHNIAGTSIAAGGVTLDMSRMRGVTVHPEAKLVHVGAGCLLKDVDEATQEYGLATVLGLVSDTGVAGLALGGGFGYLTRRFGWTVDNLEEVEIVTADGAIRTANRDENAELFWALRGGGGNLGVVTRFTFRLHDLGPTITGGAIAWNADRAGEVLAAYRDLTESAPRELTAAVIVSLAPPAPFLPPDCHGKPIVWMLVCHSGAHADADLAAVRTLADPLVDMITVKPYIDQQSMFDGELPKGFHYYLKSEYLSRLSSEFLSAFCRAALKVTSPVSESMIVHIGGALNEREPDDGAVGNRDARYVTWFDGAWPTGTHGEEHIAWARAAWETIRPFSTGGNYINFQTADENEQRVRETYGGNFDRLVEVKNIYDPDNLFRVNRNIRPAADRSA
ncbi:MAG: FAD-binding oxidoreductase [Pseudonocardiaceae bacterium]